MIKDFLFFRPLERTTSDSKFRDPSSRTEQSANEINRGKGRGGRFSFLNFRPSETGTNSSGLISAFPRRTSSWET